MRHGREFARAIKAGAWQRTAEGIYFPRQEALLSGHVDIRTRHGSRRCHNRILTGMLPLIATLLTPGGTSALLTSVYVVPWGLDVNPTPAWEAGMDFIDEWTLFYRLGELGDAPEGYDEATRPPWVYADVGGGLLDNSGTPAAFTMRTASVISVYGFALVPGSNVKRTGQPYFSGGAPGGGIANFSYVDVTTCLFPEIFSATSGYVPTGAVDTNPMGGGTDSANFGRFLTAALVDPLNPDSYITDRLSLAQVSMWYDPSGDDYYDTGAGHWQDPSGDSINLSGAGGIDTPLALVRIDGGPLMFNDMDPLNITWGMQLQT